MKTFIASAIVGLAACFAFAAPASAEMTPATAVVSYADLDLTRDADALVMVARIRDAADVTCDAAYPGRFQASHHRRCVRIATSQAVHRLHAPVVTAMLRGVPATTTLAMN